MTDSKKTFDMSTLLQRMTEDRLPLIQVTEDGVFILEPVSIFDTQLVENHERMSIWSPIEHEEECLGFEEDGAPGWVLATPRENWRTLFHHPGQGNLKKGRLFNYDIASGRNACYLLGHTKQDTHALAFDDLPDFAQKAKRATPAWEDAEQILQVAFAMMKKGSLIRPNPQAESLPGLYYAETAQEVLKLFSKQIEPWGHAPVSLHKETWEALKEMVEICAKGSTGNYYPAGFKAITIPNRSQVRRDILFWLDKCGIDRPTLFSRFDAWLTKHFYS